MTDNDPQPLDNNKSISHETAIAISTRNLNLYKLKSSTSSPAGTFSDLDESESSPEALMPQETFKLDSMGPLVLREEVKDLLEKYTEKYEDESKIDMNQLKKYVFTELQCDSIAFYDKQEEIKDIIDDIFRIQGHHLNKQVSTRNLFEIYDEKKEIDEINTAVSNKQLSHLNESEMNNIKKTFKREINKLLSATEDGKQLKTHMKEQCANKNCMDDFKDDNIVVENCPCLQRVCVFLQICREFHDILNKKTAVNFAELDNLQINNGYDAAALEEDFKHIVSFHIGHKMQKEICSQIQNKYPCKAKEKEKCYHQIRHQKQPKKTHKSTIKDKNIHKYKTVQNVYNHKHDKSLSLHELLPIDKSATTSHDVVFSQLIDTIHCYFLHSDVQCGRHPESSTTSSSVESQEVKSKYKGNHEDNKWIKSIDHMKIKKNEADVYTKLVKKMGIYRWQGGNWEKIQDWVHFKPKFINVKEEVLNNEYYGLSIDNWNQTVTKVIQFKKSFAAERMRTTRDGEYYDTTMKNKATWKKGEIPNMREITVIKLYTDWDALQAELKKCFRFLSAEDIVEEYYKSFSIPKTETWYTETATKTSDTPHFNNLKSEPVASMKPQVSKLRFAKTTPSSKMLIAHKKTSSIGYSEAIEQLKERILQFFHWRASLLIFIHKFSEIILPTHNNKEFLLYHGVNTKMILSPSSTTAYSGPLSTSTSYYVAQTFATDKGMILALSSQYPRAQLCSAFNASIISDYPEEQEYLIAHIYLRIRRVYTKSFQSLPMDSKLKFSFFVLHLFREEIYTMNPALESFIIPFIQFYLMDVIKMDDDGSKQETIQKMKQDEKKNNNINEEYKYLKSVYKWEKEKQKVIPTAPGTLSVRKPDEKKRKNRIFYIMIKMFRRIVEKQIFLKLDCISPGLRPYFLKDSGTKYTLMKRYNGLQEEVEQIFYEVSFQKLIYLFPNVEQIVFLNWYKFDNDALERLISQIRRKSNKLTSVKFLYYDYNNPLKNHTWFQDPKELKQKNINILKNKKWDIRWKQEKVGYSIKLKKLKELKDIN